MRLSRLLLAATLVVASAGTRTAFAQAKDAALDKLVADYIAAFNKGDAKAVAALYTEGSIRVTQALSADIQVSEGTYAVADLGEAQQVMWLSPHEALGHASPSALVTPSPATSRIRAFQPPSMTAPIAVMIHAPNRDTVAHVV